MTKKFTRRTFLAGTAGLAAAIDPRHCGTMAHSAAQAPAGGTPGAVHLPPVKLRGYGSLSATFRRMKAAGGPASLLHIQCASTDKAKLVHAKYLGDLTRLPGTETMPLTTKHGEIQAIRAGHGGAIAAHTAGSDVLILSTSTEKDLAALCVQNLPPGTSPDTFIPHAQVPMYLDRWDKYGLIAYYGPWTTPQGEGETYDYTQDFEYARDHGPLGLIIWDNETMNDTAEGLANMPIWDWVAEECQEYGLPLHINTSAGAALWLTNRYRDQTSQKAPQFDGNYYSLLDAGIGEQGIVSWNAGTAMDVELGVLQQTVRRFAPYPNIVGWLEPHSEMGNAEYNLLVEYGPVADAAYRQYLQEQYTSLTHLSDAWYGGKRQLHSWDEVRAPELAYFLGWGPEALDLIGVWRIQYLSAPDGHPYTPNEARSFSDRPTPTTPVPAEWYSPGFDDSAWGTLWLPGNDRQMFLPQAPAVIRRSLEISPEWLAAHPKVWLYIWDLSNVRDDTLPIYVNGHEAPTMPSGGTHWGAVEVSSLLRAGANAIAIRLPKGFLAYRCYLSPHPPVQYPALGPGMNAQWADFMGWVLWSRGQAVRRGAAMIRQIDPHRPINFMAPDSCAGPIRQVCQDYGGHFHDTGAMAGFWDENDALMMRGAGLPCSAEPGNGAHTADGVGGFRAFWGRWFTEGVQGVHYFQHLGDILWNPEVRKEFEDTRRMLQMIGKYHAPFAEVAVLYSTRSERVTGWPWGRDPNTNLTGGYWAWNTAWPLINVCPRDGVTEEDFESGNVDKYRVIIDTNTSIMTGKLLQHIEQWVRKGGTFVTFVQTGRHTPAEPDSWPIARLTGYRVQRVDRYGAYNEAQESHVLKLAPGQAIFAAEPWSAGVHGSGLSLRKVAADSQDLMLWEDGSVAAGIRALGAGRIIHLGVHFETLGNRRDSSNTTALFEQILSHLNVQRVPCKAQGCIVRHYISNNGLHDFWALYNENERPATTDLIFTLPQPPASVEDAKTGQPVTITTEGGAAGIHGLTLGPWGMRLFLSLRPGVEMAPLEWLTVQRSWWRGTEAVDPKPLPSPASDQRHSINLTENWTFKPVDNLPAAEIAALTAPSVDDTRWERIRLGIWSVLHHPEVKHAVLRQRFRVPAGWKGGEKQIWVQSWSGGTFRDEGRVYLDGKMIQDFRQDGVAGFTATDALTPGTAHVLTLEIRGKSSLCGAIGSAWVYHLPDPAAKQDLSGDWVPTLDGIHDGPPMHLPGDFKGMFLSRVVKVEAAQSHRNVLLYIQAEGRVLGVLINGTMIARHHHMIGPDFSLNLTPRIKFGEDNRIEIIHRGDFCTIRAVELRYYDPEVYP